MATMPITPGVAVPVTRLPRQFDDDTWRRLLPALRQAFPRITAADWDDCQRRIDLVVAKVQNRHWIDKITARRQAYAVVAPLLAGAGAGAS